MLEGVVALNKPKGTEDTLSGLSNDRGRENHLSHSLVLILSILEKKIKKGEEGIETPSRKLVRKPSLLPLHSTAQCFISVLRHAKDCLFSFPVSVFYLTYLQMDAL